MYTQKLGIKKSVQKIQINGRFLDDDFGHGVGGGGGSTRGTIFFLKDSAVHFLWVFVNQ